MTPRSASPCSSVRRVPCARSQSVRPSPHAFGLLLMMTVVAEADNESFVSMLTRYEPIPSNENAAVAYDDAITAWVQAQ